MGKKIGGEGHFSRNFSAEYCVGAGIKGAEARGCDSLGLDAT